MNPRETFAATATSLLDERDDVALVYAEISGQHFGSALQGHPARVINVGIREQLLVGAGAGLALAGIRPVVHTFAPFLIERAFEQVKLDFAHQGVGGVLVSTGASFDMSGEGRTHQSTGDVALMLTVPGAVVHAPSTSAEVEAAMRAAAADDGLHYIRVSSQTNSESFDPGVHVVRRGTGGLAVVAFGPVLDAALAAVEGLDATVLYANQVRPFDPAGVLAGLGVSDVVVVEPWLEGTTSHLVSEALRDRPHRLLSVGIGLEELRRYGTPEDHARAHGLDAAGIRARVEAFARRPAGTGPARSVEDFPFGWSRAL